MTYTVTITSQGQISIPAPLRKKYKMDENRYAVMRDEPNGTIVLKPMQDILSLQGAFKTTKRLTRKQEDQAFTKGMVESHMKVRGKSLSK